LQSEQLRGFLFFVVENAGYSNLLEKVINELKGTEILRLEYKSEDSGFVDIDVLLDDCRVFSYKYYYGSCVKCDDWWSRGLTDNEVKGEMLDDATIFNTKEDYEKWRQMYEEEKYRHRLWPQKRIL